MTSSLKSDVMSSHELGEDEIRRNISEADLVECMVALPDKLFYSTQIPACLWFLARDKRSGRFRDRRGQVLFIDARRMGRMVDRVHRELTDEDIRKIADTYHAWRGEKEASEYDKVYTASASEPPARRSARMAMYSRPATTWVPGGAGRRRRTVQEEEQAAHRHAARAAG
jgi:type I restriction-modification system DNA methylase subunit